MLDYQVTAAISGARKSIRAARSCWGETKETPESDAIENLIDAIDLLIDAVEALAAKASSTTEGT